MIKILAFPKNRFSQNPHISNFYKQIEKSDDFIVKDLTAINAFVEKFDIFHLHWPEFFIVRSPVKCFFRLSFFAILIIFLKIRRTKIVWTVHNLQPHNNIYPQIYVFVLRFLSNFLSGITYFSHHSKSLVQNEFPFISSIPNYIIQHALYDYDRTPLPQTISHFQKALALKKDAKLALFFGRIDHYKDIETLIIEFKKLPQQDYQLAIVGPCSDDNLFSHLTALSSRSKNIVILQSFIPEEDLASLFSMAELIILPFKKILNSGSVMLSLSFGKPVLVPAMGSIIEIQNIVGKSSVITYGQLTTNVIKQSFSEAQIPDPNKLNTFSLEIIGKMYQDFFCQIKHYK